MKQKTQNIYTDLIYVVDVIGQEVRIRIGQENVRRGIGQENVKTKTTTFKVMENVR